MHPTLKRLSAQNGAKRLALLGLAVSLAASMGCEIASSGPAAPSDENTASQPGLVFGNSSLPVFNSLGQEVFDVCHRTEGSSEFVSIPIANPAIQSHLNHGDLRPGDPVAGQAAMKLSSICTVVPSGAITLTFEGLTSDPWPNLSPFATYIQDGVTVEPRLNDWVVNLYGHPSPAIVFNTPAGEEGVGAVQVSAGGATFTFHAVDLYSSITPIPWVFTGFKGSSQVFSATGQEGFTLGAFVNVSSPNAGDEIDRLSIELGNPLTCCPNPVGLDNIVVTYTP